MADERPVIVSRTYIRVGGVWVPVEAANPMPVAVIAAGPIAIAKALIFNAALPLADTDILGAAIAPTNSPSYLRVYFCTAVGVGVFRVRRTRAGVTVSENLNNGNPLVANSGNGWVVPWRTGDTINFWYSQTGGNILSLIVDEVGV